MSKITANTILDAICLTLSRSFSECEIYTNKVEQGLTEPCFTIFCINQKIERFRGERFFKTYDFCLHYFPKERGHREECLDVLEELYPLLELIQMNDSDGDFIRGSNIESLINDEDTILTLYVTYNLYVYKDKYDREIMDELNHSILMKYEFK